MDCLRLKKNAIYKTIKVPTNTTTITNSHTLRYNDSSNNFLRIPSHITTISDDAFIGFTHLVGIFLPQGLIRIGIRAFSGCSELTVINLPNTLKYIRSHAFSSCKSLYSINIPNSVVLMDDQCFSKCISLRSVKLSENITTISEGAFMECAALGRIDIPGRVSTIESNAFLWCSSIVYANIPDSVILIKNGAFSWCMSLEKVRIHSGVTIEPFAFDGCRLTFPAIITKTTDKLNVCRICMENEITTAIVPCGHKCMCKKCADIVRSTHKLCPICRGDIQSLLVVYET